MLVVQGGPPRERSLTIEVGNLAMVAPKRDNEADRLAAVARYEILDTPPDGAFDRITALAARLFETPIAIVSIVDDDRIWFKSHHGIGTQEIGLDPGLCASAILQDELWVVENAATDPRTLTNPLVAGELGLRFYAGAPLRTHDGFNLGTLCVLDREPREFSTEQARALEDLAQIVVHELEVRIAAIQAVRHLADRERQSEETRREAERLADIARSRAADLDAAIGAVDDPFFLVGAAQQVILANPAARALLADVDGLTGLLSNLTGPEGHALRFEEIVRSGTIGLRDRRTGRMFEARAYHPPAVAVELASAVAPGNTVFVLRDVTDAERLREIREAFASMVSHELRTPVSVIYAAAELLTRPNVTRTEAERSELLAEVASAADRLRRLIEDLLVLNRAEGGPVGAAAEPVHLHHVLRSVLERERARWPHHNMTLTVDPSSPVVAGESTYVEQIVANLVSNAAKYSDADTTIDVVAGSVGKTIQVRVRDYGPGIEPADRDRLFEMRYRAPSTAGRSPGAGIGLFVCRTLAEAMGGSIRVEAPPDGGSEFVLELPAYEEGGPDE